MISSSDNFTKPNSRTPGESMICPSLSFSGYRYAVVVVCLPLPVDSDISPMRASDSNNVLIKEDFPTPDCPTNIFQKINLFYLIELRALNYCFRLQRDNDLLSLHSTQVYVQRR